MRFVFSQRFYILLVLGFIPLVFSWNLPALRTFAFVYDVFLIALALADYFLCRALPEDFTITRSFGKRFAIGDDNQVHLRIENPTARVVRLPG